jgi:hypothetical protein
MIEVNWSSSNEGAGALTSHRTSTICNCGEVQAAGERHAGRPEQMETARGVLGEATRGHPAQSDLPIGSDGAIKRCSEKRNGVTKLRATVPLAGKFRRW